MTKHSDYLNRPLTEDELEILDQYFQQQDSTHLPEAMIADGMKFENMMHGTPCRYELRTRTEGDTLSHSMLFATSKKDTQVLLSWGHGFLPSNSFTENDSFEHIIRRVEEQQTQWVRGHVSASLLTASLFAGIFGVYGGGMLSIIIGNIYFPIKTEALLVLSLMVTLASVAPAFLIFFIGRRLRIPTALKKDEILNLAQKIRKGAFLSSRGPKEVSA